MKLSAYIEITHSCNLQCSHCYNSSGGAKQFLPLDICKTIIDQLSECECNVISISGGEPLTHPHIKDILLYACEHSHAEIHLVTNGLLLSAEIVDWINQNLSNTRLSLQISMDGDTDDTYDAIRGRGNYKKIRHILDTYVATLKIPVYFHVTVYHGNVRSIENIVLMAIKYQHQSIDFAYIKNIGRSKENGQLRLTKADVRMSESLLIRLSSEYGNYLQINHPKEFYGVCPFYTDEYDSLALRIDPFGNVFPCQIMTASFFVIGNIKKEKITNIIAIDNLRKLTDRLKKTTMSKCDNCIVRPLCSKGCPATELLFDDADEDESVDCIMRVLKLQDRIKLLMNKENE